MKKIKFLSGISAMFALVAVALATTFTSCEKEEFNVAGADPTPAKLQFNVTVIDLATNTNVTSAATITGADTEENANGIAAKPGHVITATVNGAKGSVTLNIPAIEAGQIVTYSPVVFLDAANVGIAEVAGTMTATPAAAYTEYGNEGQFTHSHNGVDWVKNESNYLLPYEASWKVKKILTYVDSEILLPTISLAEYIADNKTVDLGLLEGKETLYATAWSYYNAKFTITPGKVTYEYKSVATGDVLGTAEYEVSAVEVSAENVDMEIPGHGHSYGMGHGHGHGHGAGDNAGGGIIYAD